MYEIRSPPSTQRIARKRETRAGSSTQRIEEKARSGSSANDALRVVARAVVRRPAPPTRGPRPAANARANRGLGLRARRVSRADRNVIQHAQWIGWDRRMISGGGGVAAPQVYSRSDWRLTSAVRRGGRARRAGECPRSRSCGGARRGSSSTNGPAQRTVLGGSTSAPGLAPRRTPTAGRGHVRHRLLSPPRRRGPRSRLRSRGSIFCAGRRGSIRRTSDLERAPNALGSSLAGSARPRSAARGHRELSSEMSRASAVFAPREWILRVRVASGEPL
jgi:hypothetical protein